MYRVKPIKCGDHAFCIRKKYFSLENSNHCKIKTTGCSGAYWFIAMVSTDHLKETLIHQRDQSAPRAIIAHKPSQH
jgi:hypothetical protein